MTLRLFELVLVACAATSATSLAATDMQHIQTQLVRSEKKREGSAAEFGSDGSLQFIQSDVAQMWPFDCPLPAHAKWCDVTVGNPFSMAVYDNEDIVSKSICDVGTWELQHEDIVAMGKPGHALDIGANVGFYSLVLAAAGWNVTAFEPMVANAVLIEATLCKNPSFKPKITLNKVGLGAKNEHCILVSGDDNVGDGNMKCGADAENFHQSGYHQRASMEVRRLDDILVEQNVKSIDFVKMVVEGFECNVIAGGQSLLTKFRPKMIQTEVWPKMQGCLPHDYLASFAKASYKVAQDRVCSHLDDLTNPKTIVNRYMCRKTGASLLQNVKSLERHERSIVWLSL